MQVYSKKICDMVHKPGTRLGMYSCLTRTGHYPAALKSNASKHVLRQMPYKPWASTHPDIIEMNDRDIFKVVQKHIPELEEKDARHVLNLVAARRLRVSEMDKLDV